MSTTHHHHIKPNPPGREIARLVPRHAICHALPELRASGLLGEIARLAPETEARS